MSRSARLTLTVALVAGLAAGAGCDSDGEGGADDAVCRAVDREIVVEELLTPDQPSSAFDVTADDDVWVGVIADADVSPSALASQVSGLFLIEEGAPVVFELDEFGGVTSDAPYLDFDEVGQFVPLDVAPGAYQLWSAGGPEIQVVRCPMPSG